MILITRKNPSVNLSTMLYAKTSDSRWINMAATDTKAIRKYFDDTLLKDAIRDELYETQHGLCAYCMARISINPTEIKKKDERIKIEHYSPLSANKNGVFDFNNYFLVCTGGDDEEYKAFKEGLCCDSKKKENPITIDPTNVDHIAHLQYQEDGIIQFYDQTNNQLTATIQEDLNVRLGLNGTFYQQGNNNKYDTRTRLVERRRQAYLRALNAIKLLKKKQKFTKSRLQQLIANEEATPQEFSGVILFVYRRELNKIMQFAPGEN